VSVVLTLVSSPHPQPVRQMRLEEGELIIGRAAEADWRIDDPDMFVSRAHLTVAGGGGRFTVTDTSSGGLFLDEAPRPLGPGNSAPLRHGMRMRFGDFVVQVEMAEARASAPPPPPPARPQPPMRPQPQAQPAFDADDFFDTPTAPEPRRERPPDLPDPFERPPPRQAPPPERVAPPDFDDPFTLDPLPSVRERASASASFDWDGPPAEPEPRAPRSRPRPNRGGRRPPRPEWTRASLPSCAGSGSTRRTRRPATRSSAWRRSAASTA
jgi:type VI secretion system protein ImpI